MTRASLDTNVLLRFALKDVPEEFTRARALLACGETKYQVAEAAWIEVAYALERHYGLDRPAIVDIIVSLMDIDSVETDVDVITMTCEVYQRHPKLSFADCYLATRAQSLSATPLYTFDEKLAAQHPAAKRVPGTGEHPR